MDLTPYVDDLKQRLVTAAAANGDDARRLAETLTEPLDAAVRLVLLDALSSAAGEISAELAPGSVDLRLRGGEPEFVVTAPPATTGAQPGSGPPPGATVPPETDAEGGTTRTTLRLPDHLKSQVEAAAARIGVSVNTWLVRAVASALEQPGPTRPQQWGSSRVTGWVR